MFSGFSFLFATRSPGSRSEDEAESIHFLEAPCCRNLLQAHAVFAHPPLFGTLQALQALLAWNIHSQTRDNIVNYEQFIDKRLKRQVFHNIYFGIKISVLLWIFHLKETLKMYFSKLMRITIWDRKKKNMQNITLTISTAMSAVPYISVVCCIILFMIMERQVHFLPSGFIFKQ